MRDSTEHKEVERERAKEGGGGGRGGELLQELLGAQGRGGAVIDGARLVHILRAHTRKRILVSVRGTHEWGKFNSLTPGRRGQRGPSRAEQSSRAADSRSPVSEASRLPLSERAEEHKRWAAGRSARERRVRE